MRVIVSGGGTGGHIFPAISIANALKEADPNVDILFVGAKGKMEMEKVPAAGYKIIGLPVAGFHRKLSLYNICRNMLFPFKLVASMLKARSVIKEFKPDVVIGVGGYVTVPVLKAASKLKYKTFLHEQNSVPGKANLFLANDVDMIGVSFKSSASSFPEGKTIFTGNPCSEDAIKKPPMEKSELGLDPNKKLIFA